MFKSLTATVIQQINSLHLKIINIKKHKQTHMHGAISAECTPNKMVAEGWQDGSYMIAAAMKHLLHHFCTEKPDVTVSILLSTDILQCFKPAPTSAAFDTKHCHGIFTHLSNGARYDVSLYCSLTLGVSQIWSFNQWPWTAVPIMGFSTGQFITTKFSGSVHNHKSDRHDSEWAEV